MRILAAFRGKNRDFRVYLKGLESGKVVCFEAYKKKKDRLSGPTKPINPIIA